MLTYAALSPHPPLIIPEIGQRRLQEVQPTAEGMRRLAQEMAATEPETVIFLTPHGNVFADALSSLGQPQLRGDMTAFGARQEWTASNDLVLLKEIATRSAQSNLPFIILDKDTARQHRLNPDLDHGILVPFHYLQEAGLTDVKIVAISVAYLSTFELYQFGHILEQAADKVGRKVAILASGDMSHRLKSDGPYEYHPDGPIFDQAVRELLGAGDAKGILDLPESM